MNLLRTVQVTYKILKTSSNYVSPLFSAMSSTRFYQKPSTAAAVPITVPKKKKLGKVGPILEKKVLPVETDTDRLVNYVCGSNIYKTGEDIKLKSDEEYPDWLWELNIDQVIPLEELDPNTKAYWRRLRRHGLRRNNQLAKLKRF